MIPANDISTKLTDLLRSAIGTEATLYYNEAESDVTPYVVYTIESTPVVDKSAIVAYECEARITIVALDYDTCDRLAGLIEDVMYNQAEIECVVYELRESSCSEGTWSVVLTYKLIQIA